MHNAANGRGAGSVRVGVREPGRAVQILRESQIDASLGDDGAITVLGVADPAQITWLLGSKGFYVNELVPQRVDLEAVFLELTAGHGPGESGEPRGRRGKRSAKEVAS